MSNRRRPYSSPFGSGENSGSRDVMADEMKQDNMRTIEALRGSVAQIKEASMAIKKHMIDEEGLITDIDEGMATNQSVMKQTMSKIDKIMTSASSSIMCYLLMFVFVVLALLYKLSR